ncbi:TM2 domain containing protein [Xylanimonas cellulosilytica DSM 15894]|uniref:TM2 domain containing protein n=1 Tax=Xylanimonas cellulosilytica (strain DSM 15894 / JCM 12276 / CECT 5975 / KCTC 9989 / LMG 20990 / NBRC 107835 / XIL07) TaxID=446471 RepID=D1BY14_XYLCX|nr:NINE protein [Xylanimonas cellulosilytica]ACZ29857.1 TM2 domain containing protein [Xylanimonas cellulosilytica DSM 15894]
MEFLIILVVLAGLGIGIWRMIVTIGSAPTFSSAESPKSRTVAAVLGFFLGVLGVHRFYLGNIGMGIAMLLVGWATFGIWPLLDWIIVLCGSARDGDGRLVTNWAGAAALTVPPASPRPSTTPNPNEAASQRIANLTDIAALRDAGVLTEAEFETQKRSLLG